jgi:hypothetical protein
MAKKKRGIRLKKGLPRGGLGLLGYLFAGASLMMAFYVRSEFAVWLCLLMLPVCIWCALGLRKDDDAGEVSDLYVDEESLSFTELLAGNVENPVRRKSNGLIVLCVIGIMIALCRYVFGWEPMK